MCKFPWSLHESRDSEDVCDTPVFFFLRRVKNQILAILHLFSWEMVENPFLFHKLEEENGKSSRGEVWRDEKLKQKGYFPSGRQQDEKLPSPAIRVPKLRGISKDCLIDFSPI